MVFALLGFDQREDLVGRRGGRRGRDRRWELQFDGMSGGELNLGAMSAKNSMYSGRLTLPCS